MALTTDQVHAAADALAERGERPKLTAVRRELGGGSFSTISEAMQSWRARHAEEIALQQVEVPESIKTRLDALGAAVWETATGEADARLQAERAALDQAREDAAAQVSEAQEAVRALEAEAVERDRKIETLVAERDGQSRIAEQADQARAVAEGEVATLTERIAARDERIADRDQQIVDLRDQLTKSETRADRLEAALIARDGQDSGESQEADDEW